MDYNKTQLPVLISLSYYTNPLDSTNKIFMIDLNYNNDIHKCVDQLFKDFYVYLCDHISNDSLNTIVVHNLGSFDGLFIYKYLSKIIEPENITTLIDHHNKFITITAKVGSSGIKVKWIDTRLAG